jgi:ankyrin repeat protein
MSTVAARFASVAALLSLLSNAYAAERSPLSEAILSGDSSSISQLLNRDHAKTRDADGATPLLWAVHVMDEATVRELLHLGADPSLANRYGITPLFEASRLGDASLIRVLLRAGAKVDASYPDGQTLLMAAARSGTVDGVRMLLALKPNVDATDAVEHQTPLMLAAAGGHSEVVRLLLRAGADPNRQSRVTTLPFLTRKNQIQAQFRAYTDHPHGGLTPLMFAARAGSIDTVRILLKEGHADPNIRNPGNVSAMLIAVLNYQIDVANVLLEGGANPDDNSLNELVMLHNLRINAWGSDSTVTRPIHENAISELEFMKRLLDKGADAATAHYYEMRTDGVIEGVQEPSNFQVAFSAFGTALRLNDADVLRIMLEHGRVDPNAVIDKSDLPLLLAVTPLFSFAFGPPPPPFRIPAPRGTTAAAAVLISHGADVNRTNGPSLETALHRAARGSDPELISFLVQSGAHLDARNASGLTPLDLARSKGQKNTQIVALLEKLSASPPTAVNTTARNVQ